MGRDNQQRRAAKKRKASRSGRPGSEQHRPTDGAGRGGVDDEDDDLGVRLPAGVSLQEAVDMAAYWAVGGGADRDRLDRGIRSLTLLEEQASSPGQVTAMLTERLQASTALLFDHGWQPADLAHLIKTNTTIRARRLIVSVIAVESRRTDAAARAPEPWLVQLEDLEVYEPVKGTVVGGHDGAVARWMRAERLHTDEAILGAVQVLGHLRLAPKLTALIDPPRTWTNSGRGVRPKPAMPAGDVDDRALRTIRALLAKAEGTTFEAEAEAFTAKAQELMTRHSIDAAVLAAAATSLPGRRSGVESRRVHVESPYADEKAGFLAVLAEVNSARAIWFPQAGFSTLMGFPVDLHLTEVLFTSLLVQATRASAEATSVDRRMRTPSFRRAFLVAYADRIGERLEAARVHVAAEAAVEYGSSLVPILADRATAVDEAYAEAFPNVETMRSRRLDAYGYHAGRAAADRAHLGVSEAITKG